MIRVDHGGLCKDNLTLRDYFAGKAIEGACEKMYSDILLEKLGGDTQAVADCIAAAGYQIADAMIEARNG